MPPTVPQPASVIRTDAAATTPSTCFLIVIIDLFRKSLLETCLWMDCGWDVSGDLFCFLSPRELHRGQEHGDKDERPAESVLQVGGNIQQHE